MVISRSAVPSLATLAPQAELHPPAGSQQFQRAASEHHAADTFAQRTFGDPVAVFTLWLALATTALWFVTYKLWRSTRDLALEARDTAKSQGERMERSIAEASKLAKAMEQQIAVQGLQTDILNKQKEIARLQFFAEHRPRLLLKDVYFSGDDFSELTFEIVNSGNSLAMVSGGFVCMDFVSNPNQFKRPDKGANLGPLEKTGFKGGAFRPFGLLTDSTSRVALELVSANRPTSDFYFFGMIFYTDERGGEGGSPTYATVFRRVWNPQDRRFDRTGNADHEYSD